MTLALPPRLKPAGTALAALAVLAGAGIALFHVGVEQHWWKGLATCTGDLNTAQSLSDLENQLMATPITPCDRPAWTMFRVSMAATISPMVWRWGCSAAAACARRRYGSRPSAAACRRSFGRRDRRTG